jgi:hypothetical protein
MFQDSSQSTNTTPLSDRTGELQHLENPSRHIHTLCTIFTFTMQHTGVSINNILPAAFMHADPKSAKNTIMFVNNNIIIYIGNYSYLISPLYACIKLHA